MLIRRQLKKKNTSPGRQEKCLLLPTTAGLLFLKGQKATVCCFWLLFVQVPESKVYEQNMGVSWQYSVLSEGHASDVLEKEALCLGGPKTSA